MRFRFENDVRDGDLRELTCSGAAVPLQPQIFDLLLYLVAQRARVVSRDDLISQIWSDRIIPDSALNSRINAARKALGATQRLIKTIPRNAAAMGQEADAGTIWRDFGAQDCARRPSIVSRGSREQHTQCRPLPVAIRSQKRRPGFDQDQSASRL